MASNADNLASNLSLANFSKATELKKRIWFTVGVLIAFRFLSFVPLPGIDPVALASFVERTQGGILGMFNMFSGGALENYSLISLGLMPYITASIVIQLAAALHPSLAALKKEGASGRQKLNQYTRYGTVFLTVVQGFFIARNAEVQGFAVDPSTMFYVGCIISLVGGTMFLLWMGEQITSRGIGNGVSLIIMAGIVAQFPGFTANMFTGYSEGTIGTAVVIGFIVMVIALILIICFFERAQRRLLIQYPKRATQRGMMQADRSHLPLKLNTAGVIPPIFASSLLLLPLTISQFAGESVDSDSTTGGVIDFLNFYLQHGQPIYMLLYAAGIIFFCFFYTAVVFNPEETSENLKKNGGFIPGIRPGKRTADYLDYVLTRVTVVGAIYLTLVCVIPEYMIAQTGIPLFLGGTSLLIVVNVTVDTISQVQSHLLAHQYGDLIKKAKLKGRNR
ncbi:Protein translocase subunit SecY [Alteripontixanthobacter maritimus]|uniref:Protein translocase subunit SecY n=1 Tax=Alteripontixanthobacter maritimus TaxID=2161824 RepID=A0A369QAJ9_9SPHN|nr:preprotein translocase subunit SecY [Alteripontixanthobacter maritimus]RDC60267.1 Protein translocase subunit SecY [Alteripontixanthobacter maritimus]